jgi:hypothetical protein
MPGGVATSLIVFGRGLCADGSGFRLSEASAARVRALVNYLEENQSVFAARRATVVFSGGWGGAASAMKAPPAKFREGELMFELARALRVNGKDFSCYADSYIEIDSDSTLENVLRTKDAGYLDNVSFSAAEPLGVVAHHGHQERIQYFIRKVFGLPSVAIVRVLAHGPDTSDGLLPEKMLFFFTRLAFIGAATDSSLRRRQRALRAIHYPLARRPRLR